MVGYLSLGMLSTTHEQVGYPDNPAYISDCTWPYTDHLSLWERANNAYYQNKLLGIWHDSVLPDQEKCLRKYFGPEPPPIIEVQNNFSLFLANNHWTMNYPRAFVPNVVELTGLHIEQTRKPLQEVRIRLSFSKFLLIQKEFLSFNDMYETCKESKFI